MKEIIWQGKPQINTISYPAQLLVQVTPHVVAEETPDAHGNNTLHVGLLIQIVPRAYLGARVEELPKPFEIGHIGALADPICWWRAALFLYALSPIRDALLIDLFIAAGRHDDDDDFEQGVVRDIKELLPLRVYDTVMAYQVPPGIVAWIVTKIQAGYDLRMASWQLRDEVEAGTVDWSLTLAQIGVEHPVPYRAKQTAIRALAIRYGDGLCFYAAFQEYAPYKPYRKNSGMMHTVEQKLYQCVERGIEDLYGLTCTLLLAVLRSEIELDEVLFQLAQQHPGNEYYQHQLTFHVSREERFAQLQQWYQGMTFWPSSGRWEEVEPLLRHLLDVWDQLPLRCPLAEPPNMKETRP
jgi:hypothetical protein